MVRNILEKGETFSGRNGITKSLFGTAMRFPLDNGTLPLLTTKKMAWKTCLKELLWFIKGSTSNQILKDKNVHIWNKNASRKFLDSRGLYHYPEGDLGPIYGHQWRYFNAPYVGYDTDYTNQGVDQLQMIIDKLQHPEEKYSRRLILSAWNPVQIDEMALPPCHILTQFHVNNKDELSCSLYQRSGDVGLGVPFNIASYGFLTHLLAKHCGLKAKEFIHFIGNTHIYEPHFTPLAKQIIRMPLPFPKVTISQKEDNIDTYTLDHFNVSTYIHHAPIEMKMIE